MSTATILSTSVPRSPEVNTGPRRATPALRAWVRRLEQLYGHVALLDLHR